MSTSTSKSFVVFIDSPEKHALASDSVPSLDTIDPVKKSFKGVLKARNILSSKEQNIPLGLKKSQVSQSEQVSPVTDDTKRESKPSAKQISKQVKINPSVKVTLESKEEGIAPIGPSSPSKRKLSQFALKLDTNALDDLLQTSASSTPLLTPQKLPVSGIHKNSNKGKGKTLLPGFETDDEKIDPANKENWDPIQKVYSTDRNAKAKKTRAKKLQQFTLGGNSAKRAPLKDITGLFSGMVGSLNTENQGITVFSEQVVRVSRESHQQPSQTQNSSQKSTSSNSSIKSSNSSQRKHSASSARSRILMMR